jgi:hypothetical protein
MAAAFENIFNSWNAVNIKGTIYISSGVDYLPVQKKGM